MKGVSAMEKPWIKHYDKGIPAVIDFPQVSIDRFLKDAADKYPDRAATVFGARVGPLLLDGSLTYIELNGAVNRFAAGLQKMGIMKGERVAIMLPNCPQFVIAAYATWRIGAIVVCCNPLYMPREIEYLINDSGAGTIIVMSSLYGRVKGIRKSTCLKKVIVTNIKEYFPASLKLLFGLTREKKEGHRVDISDDKETYWFQDIIKISPDMPETVDIKPDDTSTLIYTSGTTGKPKGAQHTHASQVFNSCLLNIWAKSRKGEDIMLAAMPFFHIYGLAIILNTAIAGGLTTVLIPNPRDMKHVLMAIEKHHITYYLGVPAMFVGFNNHPERNKYDMSSLRFAASAAAPLAPEVQTQFEANTRGKMVEAYGLTETICASMNPIDNVRHNSIGVPMPNTDMKIVDADNGEKELLPDEIGEIIIKGPQVMKGYWEKAEDTAGVLHKGPDGEQGWFYSGDIGYVDKDGFFHIVDRKKDIIITSGYNVYPAEVESVLFEHPSIMEAAAVGMPDESRGEIVKAFIVLKSGENAGKDDIMAFCRERMAAFKVPKVIEFRTELPKSLVGKVLRRELRDQA
ncbi:MAG: long-chain fatty acid--CoA ligase [Proteobacteria bacterium]|nr:long-chain fatty acid--CoA ligase [Pseudomonadota bacterium]